MMASDRFQQVTDPVREGQYAVRVEVRPGDSVFIPAGVRHWYENRDNVAVRFLCVVPATNNYQTEWLEEPAD